MNTQTNNERNTIPVVEDDAFSYDGYQVVRGEFFAHTYEPSFTFNSNKVSVNTACIKKDTMELLRKYRPKGVMHCFSGSAEIAREIVAMGMYVGFTGVVTYKNAKKALKALEAEPLDRLLVETDCPYMAPEPNRGKRNYSGYLPYTVAAMAAVKGVSPDEMAEITAENAERLFNI